MLRLQVNHKCRTIFLLGLLALTGVVAAFAISEKRRHAAKADTFDLSIVGKMEEGSLILDRKGGIMGRIFVQNRDRVPLGEISSCVKSAVIAAEDRRFYSHSGADYFGIARAFVQNALSKGIRQGASTITQQLARNTFSLTERSYERKAVEVFLARRIERTLSKDQIFEHYLNLIYLGSGYYGVESAAWGYFGKSCRALEPAEAATLAGIIKSPNRLSPHKNPTGAKKARDIVLRAMLDTGALNQKEFQAAIDSPLRTVPKVTPARKGQSYAIDTVRQQVVAALGFEAAAKDGYQIHTTIDPDIQNAVTEGLREQARAVEGRRDYQSPKLAEFVTDKTSPAVPGYLQYSALAVENSTGAIVAMVGGRNFEHSEFNRVLQAKRPAGTVFSPIVYAAALAGGMFPGKVFADEVIDNRLVMIGGTTGILGEWGVETATNAYEGPLPAREIIARGKNSALVRMGYEIGVPAVASMATNCGITSPLTPFPASFLGSSEVSLAELTLAYTSFPSLGKRPQSLHIIDHITDRSGEVVYRNTTILVRAMSPEVAYETHLALRDSLSTGTAATARTDLNLGSFDAGVKTGSAYNFTDNWAIGYNSKITCGMWLGFDRPTSIFNGAFGNQTLLPAWVKVMNTAAAQTPPPAIQSPGDALTTVQVCRKSGLLSSEKCAEDESGRFTYLETCTPDQAPKGYCTFHNPSLRIVPDETKTSPWPRAIAALPAGEIKTVRMKGPTVVGDDPFRSIKWEPPAEETTQAEPQENNEGDDVDLFVDVYDEGDDWGEQEMESERTETIQVLPALPPDEPEHPAAPEPAPDEPPVRKALPVEPSDSASPVIIRNQEEHSVVPETTILPPNARQ